jgi:hypothetical protein
MKLVRMHTHIPMKTTQAILKVCKAALAILDSKATDAAKLEAAKTALKQVVGMCEARRHK